MSVTIADSLFMQYGKSAKLGNGNSGVPPTHFEWELGDPETAQFVTDASLKHAKGPGQVAFLLESFFLHPEDYLTAMQVPFDFVLTHNRYFSRHKGWLWYPAGGSFVDFKDWKIQEKSKDISVLLSPKKTIWGHRVFHEIAERYGDRIDVFGLDHHVDKMEAIAPYRFTIVVEGEVSESYFSEKLIDCLALGTVPIYWGCPNIGQFFDARGMVLVNDLGEVGHVLDILDPDSGYRNRIPSIRFNFEKAREYRIPEDWIYKNYHFLFREDQ